MSSLHLSPKLILKIGELCFKDVFVVDVCDLDEDDGDGGNRDDKCMMMYD